MSVHPDGSGTGWTAVETVDIDQPHGKDYLWSQHIAKGIRKRINKEHVAFGDTTAGGEHLPGGCRILGIVDTTADLTKAAGDASYDVTTGKFIGRGLFYDQTNNALWCMTNSDGTTTNSPYMLMFGPDCISKGADFTWEGDHDFRGAVCFSAVDISNSLDLTGALACGSTATIMKLLTCSSGFVCDGTAVFTSEMDISGNCDISGSLKVTDVSISGTSSIAPLYAGGESITFPNGLIMKMGYVARSASTQTVTFASAFPTGIVSVVVTTKYTTTGSSVSIISGYSVTSFVIIWGADAYTGATWIAIGR